MHRDIAKSGGFSLVELMVVLAIVAIALGLVLPAMGNMVQDIQLRASRDALLASLDRARFEAIRHSGRIVMCKSADGIACNTQDSWHQGWIIFHDSEGSGDGQRNGAETVLYREPAQAAAVRISANTKVLPNYVAFDAQGSSRSIDGGLLIGAFFVCVPRTPQNSGFEVVLRQGGRTRVQALAPAQVCN